MIALNPDQSPGTLAKEVLDDYISSSKETILGNTSEKLAIAINAKVYGGYKAEEGKYAGIDLIFHKDGIKYMISIKSGTNWGNSDQKKAMKMNFTNVQKRAREEGWNGEIVLVNGCAYGKSLTKKNRDANFPDSDYYLMVGKDFWKFISGEEDMERILLEAITKATKDYFIRNKENYQAIYNSKLKEIEDYIIEITKDEDGKLNTKELAQILLSNKP